MVFRRLVSVVGVLAVSAAVVAMSVPAGPRDDWTIFTDPSGDAKGAADITKVALSHSETAGTFTIEITASRPTLALGAPAATPPPRPTITTYFVGVRLDVDRNAATGAPGGFEYSFTSHGASWEALAWDGTKLQPAAFTPVTSFNGYGLYTWTIRRSDVGNPTGFAFAVSSGAIVDGPAGITTLGPDLAPDGGTWTYDLVPAPPPPPTTPTTSPAPVGPVIGAPSWTPARPLAGKRARVSFRVTRGGTGQPLTSGRMICDPSIGGTILKHAESFTGGTARLSLTVPRGSKGKQLRIKVTIQSGTQSATRLTTVRIR